FGFPISGDYSLSVRGNIGGIRSTTLDKLGSGQLILPRANSYAGPTSIQAGWVTMQNNNSLGPRIFGIGDTAQPMVTVFDGASLHLKPLTPGANLNLDHNLSISGTGMTHPFSMIGREGALMSLGGGNTVSGNIEFHGQAGI